MEKVARVASGYIYYVSLKGVTGASQPRPGRSRAQDSADPIPHQAARSAWASAFAMPHTAQAVARISDAVVIGSRLVQEIESSSPEQVVGNVKTLVGGIRRAMDE